MIRHLNYDPLRGLRAPPDAATNGIANLGASLLNGHVIREEAATKAAEEERKIQASLFENSYKKDRAAATDRQSERSFWAGREDAQTAGDDRRTAAEDRRTAASALSADQSARRTHEADTLTEMQRHNKATEGNAAAATAAKDPRKEAAVLAADLWNKAGIRATVMVQKPDGTTVRQVDEAKHRQYYEEARKVTGRDDLAHWDDIQSAADAHVQQVGPNFKYKDPNPTWGIAGPGMDNVSGTSNWNAEQDQSLGSPGKPNMTPRAGFESAGAPAPTRATPTPTPVTPGIVDTPAPVDPAPALSQALNRLHPDDQKAFARIVASGDPTRIKIAQDRLLKSVQPATPVPVTTPSGAGFEERMPADAGDTGE